MWSIRQAAPLHLHVLVTEEQTRILKWEFKEDSAMAVEKKQNKVVIVTDGQSLTKLTLFEEFSTKMEMGKNYVMRGYSLRGDTPPRHILVTKMTAFF